MKFYGIFVLYLFVTQKSNYKQTLSYLYLLYQNRGIDHYSEVVLINSLMKFSLVYKTAQYPFHVFGLPKHVVRLM